MTDPATCPHPVLVVEAKILVRDGKTFASIRVRCQVCKTFFNVIDGQTEPRQDAPTTP
jgi:hypothetical protein